jgi:RNA polymerase sigma-70 factor (ECF subfamily)
MTQHVRDAGQWLSAAHAGSADALGQALEACRGYLLLIAQQELDADLRAKGGASDLVQETFLKAHRHFGRFHGSTEEELLAWLRRLLLNNLADFRRLYRATDKRRASREVALEAGDSSAERGAVLAADEPSPSKAVMGAERAAALQQVIDTLPEDYRRVLQLRHQEEQSFEEIGRRLHRSANAARKLWARAVERLQQAWERRHERG